ncbi:MAG TPA: TIGR01777 family oxidoreductase [Rhodothermales bacterium]|nr:TIGR01777 family oxidoreductase [Rhodothermales bacterium]
MPTLTFKSSIDAPAEALFAWHTRPGAFQRLIPPWEDVRVEKFEGIRDGKRAVLKTGIGPMRVTWIAEHHDYVEGRQFYDRQVKGPFRRWDHQHRMEPDGDATSFLTDHIEYALPLGGLGEMVAGSSVRKKVERQFAYRHRITQQDLALHQRYNPDGQRLRIAVSGASGLIGSHLVPFLTAGGHEVMRLVRSQPTQEDEIYWNHRTGEIEAKKLEGLDAVIHLAGEPVLAPRWTEDKKMRILASRVEGTRLLSETLARMEQPPNVFLSASGVAYYGNRGAEKLTETSAPGKQGFLTVVSQDWEAATEPAAEAGIRTVPLRIGIVLSLTGGALETMLPFFRVGLGGYVGDGTNYVPWITLDDVLGAIYHVLMTDVQAAVNLTAPDPLPMAVFTQTLAKALHRPSLFKLPAPLAKLVTGEVAREVLVTSNRVLPQRLQQTGYTFQFRDLASALPHLLGQVP